VDRRLYGDHCVLGRDYLPGNGPVDTRRSTSPTERVSRSEVTSVAPPLLGRLTTHSRHAPDGCPRDPGRQRFPHRARHAASCCLNCLHQLNQLKFSNGELDMCFPLRVTAGVRLPALDLFWCEAVSTWPLRAGIERAPTPATLARSPPPGDPRRESSAPTARLQCAASAPSPVGRVALSLDPPPMITAVTRSLFLPTISTRSFRAVAGPTARTGGRPREACGEGACDRRGRPPVRRPRPTPSAWSQALPSS
jgi:hypothetical protein